jgi:uncharacterized Ntn-hydrolase superfamily protein
MRAPLVATFSIVARDPTTGDFGVAVQSRYFAVGGVVPHAAADTGAVATQARANFLYGIDGLELLESGMSAESVIKTLTAADPLRAQRQLGVVDRDGKAATYTGEQCIDWAGGRVGSGYAVQGNLLAGPQVVDAMAAAYEAADGEFADRLLSALYAGQAAGGDARGRQSAAVLVARKGGGYLGLNDRYIDLHVEDHPTPIFELERLLHIRQAQLDSAAAIDLLTRAAIANEGEQATLLAKSAGLLERALRRHPQDDYSWWTLAKVRLAQQQPDFAAMAARQALQTNPHWRHLPPSTRQALGVPPELISRLLQIESFRSAWDGLAAKQQAGP